MRKTVLGAAAAVALFAGPALAQSSLTPPTTPDTQLAPWSAPAETYNNPGTGSMDTNSADGLVRGSTTGGNLSNPGTGAVEPVGPGFAGGTAGGGVGSTGAAPSDGTSDTCTPGATQAACLGQTGPSGQ